MELKLMGFLKRLFGTKGQKKASSFTPFSKASGTVTSSGKSKPSVSIFIPTAEQVKKGQVSKKASESAIFPTQAPGSTGEETTLIRPKPASKDKEVICSNCGHKLSSAFRFCNRCGAKVKK